MPNTFQILDFIRIILIIAMLMLCLFLWLKKHGSFNECISFFGISLIFNYLIPNENVNSIFQHGDTLKSFPFLRAMSYNIAFFIFSIFCFLKYFYYDKQ